MNKVCVLGSINMDLVVKVNEIPRIGETILSKSFEKIAGGKGANQAIAARRCGAEVSMIAKIGKDENGKILKSKLEEDKISTSKHTYFIHKFSSLICTTKLYYANLIL